MEKINKYAFKYIYINIYAFKSSISDSPKLFVPFFRHRDKYMGQVYFSEAPSAVNGLRDKLPGS